MPILRFPDLSKTKLDVEGKFRAKIVAITFKRSKNNTPLILVTFETLKTQQLITQSWPIFQCRNSLLHMNLKKILRNQELAIVNTDDLLGLKCRIKVFKNNGGFLEVKGITKKSAGDGEAEI